MVGSPSWLDAELPGSAYSDPRLGKRLRARLERVGGGVRREPANGPPGSGGDQGGLSVL